MLLVAPALDLDKVGEDRRDDPTLALALVFAPEGLAEQGQRLVLVVRGAGDQPEAAQCESLPAGALRFLGDRERTREPLVRAVEIVPGAPVVTRTGHRPCRHRAS